MKVQMGWKSHAIISVIILVALAAATTVGCKRSGDGFVGRWKVEGYSPSNSEFLIISRNGDQFVADAHGRRWTGKLVSGSNGHVLKFGDTEPNGWIVQGEMTLSNDGGTIYWQTGVYHRTAVQ